ncbi:hypothetical protein [Haloarcula marina]|uniref:hypothetical protein n=1 Tax=Haloarcula marina TaxID=2961574 RepID=UPI0020B89FDB|nr:hypothetical protein [Halomicroarcula marina]
MGANQDRKTFESVYRGLYSFLKDRTVHPRRIRQGEGNGIVRTLYVCTSVRTLSRFGTRCDDHTTHPGDAQREEDEETESNDGRSEMGTKRRVDDDGAYPDDAFGEVSAAGERLEKAHHHQPEENKPESGGEHGFVEPSVVRTRR